MKDLFFLFEQDEAGILSRPAFIAAKTEITTLGNS